MKKHLVIIDGHHLMYRAYWAIPRTMKNAKGEQTNTSFGMAGMLMQILKTEQPDSVLFCFDADEETFRKAEYADYKEGRASTPDDFYSQVPRAMQLVDAFGAKSVSGQKHEADDCACAYAKEAVKKGMRVTIVSGDRDLLQIVDEDVRVAVPHKGYQEAEYMGPGEVYKKYGITPAQVPAYKGLVGDSSDNLPGVKGIGPKAAAALIQEYGSIEAIYKNLSKIKESWRKKLEEGRESAFFCERMATLVCDLNLPVPLHDLVYENISVTPIVALFQELSFSLLSRRFESFLKTDYGAAHFSGEFSVQEGATKNPKLSHSKPSKGADETQLLLL